MADKKVKFLGVHRHPEDEDGSFLVTYRYKDERNTPVEIGPVREMKETDLNKKGADFEPLAEQLLASMEREAAVAFILSGKKADLYPYNHTDKEAVLSFIYSPYFLRDSIDKSKYTFYKRLKDSLYLLFNPVKIYGDTRLRRFLRCWG